MGRYIATRLLHAAGILVIVTVLVFVIARLIPGDAIMAAMSGSVDMVNADAVKRVRAEYGLDLPMYMQFVLWLDKFVTGDWGVSLGTGQRVMSMFTQRLPITLELFLGATLWSFAIGIPVGIVAALKRNSKLDMFLTTVTVF